MITTKQLLTAFGDPITDRARFERDWMMVWDIPDDIDQAIPPLPARIYINKIAQGRLEDAFRAVISAGLAGEIRTWDGCFVVRKQRGSSAISRHSFGVAIDMNAAWNPLVMGVTPAARSAMRMANVKWTERFLDCFRQTGWVCGADWQTRLDGMHFELAKI